MISVMRTNESYALDRALELAKIVCANPNCKIEMDKDSAQKVVDFIHTVADGIQSGGNTK